MPSASRWAMSNTMGPSACARAPSAMVLRGNGMRTMCPARSDCWPSLATSGSTPYTRHSGVTAWVVQAARQQTAAAHADKGWSAGHLFQ